MMLTAALLMTLATYLLIKSIVPLYANKYSETVIQERPGTVLVLLTIIYIFISCSMLSSLPAYNHVVGFLLVILVVTAAIIDNLYTIIPDRLLTVFLPGILLTKWFSGGIMDGLIGATFAFVILLTFAVISKGGFGGGDIKLVTLIGLGTSYSFVYQLLFISCLITFIFGITALLSGIKQKGDIIPFGPAIAFTVILLVI